jgi:hypothetical protein
MEVYDIGQDAAATRLARDYERRFEEAKAKKPTRSQWPFMVQKEQA